jgi:hypothetical protein
MFSKGFLKFAVAFGLLAALLIFLGVSYVPRISALPSASENVIYAGADWIERHPSNLYINSDWIERHPPAGANLDEVARIKDEGFAMDTRLSGSSQLEELARIKDEVFLVEAPPTGPSRLEVLARIKDDLMP